MKEGFLHMRSFGIPPIASGSKTCFPPKGRLAAIAYIHGSALYPDITGEVRFYSARGGTVVEADIRGLPPYRPAEAGKQPQGPFGFHIHAMSECGNMSGPDPFMAAGDHFDKGHNPHGNHSGDLPVLFSNNGVAQMSVFTDRFTPAEVVGRTAMIHQNPDDFRTQPSGNSGARIACGEITRV